MLLLQYLKMLIVNILKNKLQKHNLKGNTIYLKTSPKCCWKRICFDCWCKSSINFLTCIDRVTKVSIDGEFSSDHVMRYSLPQGAVLGPHGFILYTSPIGNIRAFNISFHAYADDIQLYAEFDPKSNGDCE